MTTSGKSADSDQKIFFLNIFLPNENIGHLWLTMVALLKKSSCPVESTLYFQKFRIKLCVVQILKMDDSINSSTNYEGEPSTSAADTQETNQRMADISTEKTEEPNPMEECTVCKSDVKDATTLSNCSHIFCYECIMGWIVKGSGRFCPLCKAPVEFIKRESTNEQISLEEINKGTEPVATASADLVTEKRIVSRKIRSCRRLMNRIEDIIAVEPNRKVLPDQKNRVMELHDMKLKCVAQLNSLQMLRDDIDHGAAKALIVSRPEFRRLIYERQVVSEGLPTMNNMVEKQEFLAEIEHYRAVLNSFLKVELKALPVREQPKVDQQNRWHFNTVHEVIDSEDDEYVNKIFSLVAEKGVANLREHDVILELNNLISFRVATLFISEIRSLINSRMSYLDWCGAVTYRIATDIGGESGNGNEVYTVDDTMEEVQPNRRSESRRLVRFPVFSPIDQVFPVQSSSHYNRNHRRESSSDTDQDEDIYFQAPLRLGSSAIHPFRPDPHPAFPPIPPAGISWNDLTKTEKKKTRTDSSKVPLVSLDDDEIVCDSENNERNEIQVVDNDGTIVLDDTIDSPSKRRNETIHKKRKNEDRPEDNWKKAKINLIPDGLIEDMQKLLQKYNLPLVNALDIMEQAAREAIVKNSTVPRPSTLAEALSRFSGPSTSTTIAPEEALQLAGSSDLARNGMNLFSNNASMGSNRGKF